MRKLIAAGLIFGSAATALIFATFLFGCCVLPFHRVLHRAFPICGHISGYLAGAHRSDYHDRATPVAPANPKPSPILARVLPIRALRFNVQHLSQQLLMSPATHNRRALRNLRSLGALRVDDDIGLHALFETFLI